MVVDRIVSTLLHAGVIFEDSADSATKGLLAQMLPPERSFFLLARHMQNELNSLHKMFAWCLHTEPSGSSSAIEGLANGIQAQIYARLHLKAG